MNISTSNLLQEISEVFELIDDTIFESMYTDNTDFTSIEFCELAKISKKNKLEKNAEIIHSNLDTIEKIGGGSARCMIAENFLQKKNKKD